MMQWYVEWVKASPMFSAAIQFAILGPLGEIISATIKNRKASLPCKWWELILKSLAWALLGLIIKYGFVGMKGFVFALHEHNLLPDFMYRGILKALTISVVTNILFGPQMMFFHRIEDNLILRRWTFDGIQKSWKTLLWFWIPAHTVTFSLPTNFQIGLAAVWGLVLGIIMGMGTPKREESVTKA